MASDIFAILYLVLYLLSLAFAGRIIFSWIQVFAPNMQLKGIFSYIGDVVYKITNPIMKPIQKVLPALRLGSVGLDFSIVIVFFVIQFLMTFCYNAAINAG